MAESAVVRRERLAERRKALGLTQERLAELLGVERTTVARWERGEARPLPALRVKLAKALQVSADRVELLLAADGPLARPEGRAAVVPRLLPTAPAGFTGRTAELGALTQMLDQAGAGPAGTVVISAIGGMGGVGKTALALQWAHQVADRFPDGQLYTNLRGFDPSGAPAAPEVAIRGFLDALGVPTERIPPTPEAQADLYRSLLADKAMLVVVDNVRDEQQVRPLLPASPASLVVVTSRRQLAGLAVAEGARLMNLDVLSHAEAVQLLTARLGPARAGAEPAALDQIARLCARLPLALAVAAARAAARPQFSLAALAAELADSAARLDALDLGDPWASVRAVFSWSTRQLSEEPARLFRLLGLHPGPDISVPAAASLADRGQPQARRLLGELAGAHLIDEHLPGRYALHDLLRAFAADQAHHTDSATDRHQATGRMLDYYLHTAAHAGRLVDPTLQPVALAAPRSGVVVEAAADVSEALAWFEAEHRVLLAAVTLAAAADLDGYAWQLPWAMTPFLDVGGHWQAWAATQRAGLAAADRLGDTAGQAVSRRLLANALTAMGEFEECSRLYAESLALYQRLGDRASEARIHHNLGVLAAAEGRYAEALRHSEQAVSGYQAVGNKAQEAISLNNVGYSHALLGDYEEARTLCRRSLTLVMETGQLRHEATVWDSLGYAEHHLGNLAEAAACYRRALDINRRLGDRHLEALMLSHLGETSVAAGELTQAQEAWQQALDIFEDLHHPDADQVRAKLKSANNPG